MATSESVKAAMSKRDLKDPLKALEWFSLDPKERTKSKRLQSKYGIDLADRNALAKSQEYKCEICKVEDYLVTDHDHNIEGPSFRGLICLTCNAGLGMFHDSIELLSAAIEYLKVRKA